MSSSPNNRFLALDFAVRHKTREESADRVLQSAEKYLAFLEGKKVASVGAGSNGCDTDTLNRGTNLPDIGAG